MLLIFAFSITPKLILHDLFVHHKDKPVLAGQYAQVSKTGFHCDCENQVVELPYLFYPANQPADIPRSFQIFQTGICCPVYSSLSINFGLRGPPFPA
jgi:hypothetical protein